MYQSITISIFSFRHVRVHIARNNRGPHGRFGQTERGTPLQAGGRAWILQKKAPSLSGLTTETGHARAEAPRQGQLMGEERKIFPNGSYTTMYFIRYFPFLFLGVAIQEKM